MGKGWSMVKENGQERFDGFDVNIYDGKFTGGFDLDEDLGQKIGFDDVVTFVVTGRVGSVGISETKLGDLKRTNTFHVTNSVALAPKQAEALLNSLGESVNGVNAGQLTIDQALALNDAEVTDVSSGNGSASQTANPLDPASPIPVNDPELEKWLNA